MSCNLGALTGVSIKSIEKKGKVQNTLYGTEN